MKTIIPPSYHLKQVIRNVEDPDKAQTHWFALWNHMFRVNAYTWIGYQKAWTDYFAKMLP